MVIIFGRSMRLRQKKTKNQRFGRWKRVVRSRDLYAVLVQDLAAQWRPSYAMQNRNFTRNEETLDANASPKVIYSDNSLEFGKDCEDRGIIVHQRLIDRRQMVLQSGQYAG